MSVHRESQRMRPRTAGVVGMVAAVIVGIVGGVLLGRPPFGIPGAVVLVLGGILFAVAATWIVRNSWNPAEWPDFLPMTQVEAMRKLRKWMIYHVVFLSTMLIFVIASLVLGWGVSWALLILLAVEVMQVVIHAKALRLGTTETRDPEHPSAP